jgi:hypothetical protein
MVIMYNLGMGWKMMKVAVCYSSLVLCSIRILSNAHNIHGGCDKFYYFLCGGHFMYNRVHGLENDARGGLRCLRTHLNSLRRASDPLRLEEVPEYPVGSRRSRWTHERGAE